MGVEHSGQRCQHPKRHHSSAFDRDQKMRVDGAAQSRHASPSQKRQGEDNQRKNRSVEKTATQKSTSN